MKENENPNIETWEKCLEAEKMKENENPNTEMSEGFFIFIFMRRTGLNLGILFLG